MASSVMMNRMCKIVHEQDRNSQIAHSVACSMCTLLDEHMCCSSFMDTALLQLEY
jgi:hypothetical protein